MLDKHNIRNAFIWPTALRMMSGIKGIRSDYTIRLRSIVTGGEILGSEVMEWAKEELGITINEHYGQTEADYLVGNCSAIMKVRPGSMGKPYPGHMVDVIDEEGNSSKPGEVGEIVVKRPDPVMFLGYWRNEAATEEKFMGDWWLTGDAAKRDEDGYLWHVGRKDDTIKSSGYRIGPSEIEDCLSKHPAVGEVGVIGSPDEIRGDIVKAFIKTVEGFAPSKELEGEIQEHVKKNLAFYQYPREVEFINEFPKTTSGKINRSELKRMEIDKKRRHPNADV
jgi:acetyl-CoA synthetase